MVSLPQRTGTTQLTDDEVLLFDFLFDSSAGEGMLRRDAYPLHMNVAYTHNLTDDHLHETLLRLAWQGLVVAETKNGLAQWALTPLGGSQWEVERQPLWDAYCTESRRFRRSGRSMLTIMSPDRTTAETFWYIGTKTRLWNVENGQPRYWRIENHRLIPWRGFSAVHVIIVHDADYGGWETDWEAYENERTWWRTITELDSLRTRLK